MNYSKHSCVADCAVKRGWEFRRGHKRSVFFFIYLFNLAFPMNLRVPIKSPLLTRSTLGSCERTWSFLSQVKYPILYVRLLFIIFWVKESDLRVFT
jgi:hypothetical protein